MKVLLSIMLLMFISCTHHHQDTNHHHHKGKSNLTKSSKDDLVMYDKTCASSILNGDTHIEGKEEFQLEHGGRFYYFSSKEKMDNFKLNLDNNISDTDKRWNNNR